MQALQRKNTREQQCRVVFLANFGLRAVCLTPLV